LVRAQEGFLGAADDEESPAGPNVSEPRLPILANHSFAFSFAFSTIHVQKHPQSYHTEAFTTSRSIDAPAKQMAAILLDRSATDDAIYLPVYCLLSVYLSPSSSVPTAFTK
jgi:hypothetical protein